MGEAAGLSEQRTHTVPVERPTMKTYLDRAASKLETLQRQHPQPSTTSELLTALSAALDTYIYTPDLTKTFVQLLPELLHISESDFGFLAEVAYQGETPYLQSHAVVDIYKPNYTRYDIVSNPNFWNLDTLNGAIMTSKALVVSNDPNNDRRAGGVPLGHMKLQAFLGMPFMLEGELLGASSMANKPGFCGGADVELVGHVAEIGGLLIAADRQSSNN